MLHCGTRGYHYTPARCEALAVVEHAGCDGQMVRHVAVPVMGEGSCEGCGMRDTSGCGFEDEVKRGREAGIDTVERGKLFGTDQNFEVNW